MTTPLAAARIVDPEDQPTAAPTAESLRPRPPLAASTLDLRSQSENYRKARGFFHSTMGELLGFSRSHYSKWERGQLDVETSKNVEAAVRRLLDKEQGERGLIQAVGFRPIQMATEVFNCLKLAWDGGFVVMVAESGTGKSEAIKEDRRLRVAAGKPLPVYVRATAFTSGAALMAALVAEAGLDRRGTPDALLRALADKLHDEPRIVILDEAHRCHPKGIEALRDLWEMAGVGVVLSCTSLVAGLARGALGKANLIADILEHRPEAEQLTRRVFIRELEGITEDEVDLITLNVLGPCMDDAREEIIARAGRSTGRMARHLDAIQRWRAAKKLTGPVTLEQVVAAWRQLYRRQKGPRPIVEAPTRAAKRRRA